MLIKEVKKIADDIQSMKIRGAGKIARTAVLGLKITAENTEAKTPDQFYQNISNTANLLIQTRPSAVSLPNSIRYVMKRVKNGYDQSVSLKQLKEITIKSASTFIKESNEAVKRIGEIGSRRIKDGDNLMTICNSSSAISVMKTAFNQGKQFHVFVAETRPRFQGHLTAKSLDDAGISVSLIVDSAVRYFVNDVDSVIVGADTITANGAVINKIGTATLALAAHEARTNLLVAAETYKFSPETMTGLLIEIEEREPYEVMTKVKLAEYKNLKVRNPAFDVTPSEYIDVIITEKGIIPPQAALMILRDEYGWVSPDQLLKF